MKLWDGGPQLLLQPVIRAHGATSIYMKRLEYEPELALLATLIRPGDVLCDIGANVGVYALVMAASLESKGQVYAFEPGATALIELRGNVGLNQGLPLTVVPLALSHSPGSQTLHHVGGASTTFSMGGTGGAGEASEDVAVTTLDLWAREAQLPSLNIIKIDVEGHEPAVFAGGEETLRVFRPMIMFEVSVDALQRNGYAPSVSFDQLIDLEYAIFVLHHGRPRRLLSVEEGNLFAVPEAELGSDQRLAIFTAAPSTVARMPD